MGGEARWWVMGEWAREQLQAPGAGGWAQVLLRGAQVGGKAQARLPVAHAGEWAVQGASRQLGLTHQGKNGRAAPPPWSQELGLRYRDRVGLSQEPWLVPQRLPHLQLLQIQVLEQGAVGQLVMVV